MRNFPLRGNFVKHSIIFFCLVIFLLQFSPSSLSAQSNTGQFMFSVKPGLFGFSGGAFGYKMPNDLVVLLGIDYLHIGSTVSVTTDYFLATAQYDTSFYSQTETSLSIYNPYASLKYFFVKANAIKGYLQAEISKPIIKASITYNGKENESVKSFTEKLNVWGIKGAFGTEYFFSDNFSLGGEFGIRFLLLTSKPQTESPYYYYDPSTGRYVEGKRRTETKIDINLSLTYSALALNYYF